MMDEVLDEICAYIHNWFIVKPDGVHKDVFNISSGELDCDFLKDGQYFRIVGSLFNDGVYKYPAKHLQDEEFIGEIWAMAVPLTVLAIKSEIEDWNAKYANPNTASGAANYSPFVSESFNNYSYSKGSRSNSSGSSSTGSPLTWKDIFGNRLLRWKRVSDVI